mgnify:CR=1 FL=1
MVSYFDSLGGVNNSVSDEDIADTELSDAANYQPDQLGSGVLIKREGVTKESSAMTERISAIYEGRNANYFSTLTTLRALAGTSLDTGLTSATDPDWCSFDTYDCFVNGTEARKSANGTSFTAISGIPSGTKYIATLNNFMFGAGHSRGALRWTNVGDAEDWPTTNELVLNQDEANDIVGLKKFDKALMVHCQKSYHFVDGFGALDMEVVGGKGDDGTTSHRSVTVLPGKGICWWSSKGLGIALLSSDMTSLDYPMVRKLQGTLSTINFAQASLFHSCLDPRQKRVMFWVCVSSSSTVNLRIDYYYEQDAFYLHTGAGIQMAASGLINRSGQPKVYVGMYGTSNVYVHEQTGATDDGTAITAYVETKREAQGSFNALKIAREVAVSTNLTTGESITYGYYIDNATATTATHAFSPGTSGAETLFGINRMHYKIKHRVTDAATTRTRIYGIVHEGDIVRSRAA